MNIQEQNLLQAFARVYVNNQSDLIKLITKYGYIANPKDNEIDVLLYISSLEGNENFDKELTDLLQKKGKLILSDYKNVLAELIAGAVNAIATMTGKIVGQKGVRVAGVLQTQSQTQQALLQAIAQEKELKAKQQKTNIIIFSIVGTVLFGTIAILILKR